MAFAGAPAGSQNPATDLWLRFPDNVGQLNQINLEQAVLLLTQALEISQRVPFAWSYIDKPPDGQAFLVYIFTNNSAAFASDGIRWLDQEKVMRVPAGHRELEVSELKFGFVPGAEATANRVRRRYRLTKGGNPQLMLLHYHRGEGAPVPPNLLNIPIRNYPLRPIAEPRLFVAGERMGQKVPVNVPPQTNGVPMANPMPPAPIPGNPMMNPGMNPMGMNQGLGLGINAAQLAHQNQTMEAMERERRARAIPPGAYPPAATHPAPGAVPPGSVPVPRPLPEEEDSGDEYEVVSTRTLSIERFKRNHELMAEVFTAASKGIRSAPPQPSPYESLDINELNRKVGKLEAEVEALKAKAEERRLARQTRDLSDSSMDVNTSPLLMATS